MNDDLSSDPILAGCGSHSCVIKTPKGLGTNGSCMCRPITLQYYVRKLKAEIAQLKRQMEAMRNCDNCKNGWAGNSDECCACPRYEHWVPSDSVKQAMEGK